MTGYNHESGQSRWTRPPEVGDDDDEASTDGDGKKKSVWEAKLDENSGRQFFWNTATGQSVWEKPKELEDEEEGKEEDGSDAGAKAKEKKSAWLEKFDDATERAYCPS